MQTGAMDLLIYAICVFGLSVMAVRMARVMAIRRALLDVPNDRSSHKVPVPRLGGAAFVAIVLLFLGMFSPHEALPPYVFSGVFAGMLALYGISLADDLLTLPAGIRFAVQFVAAGFFVWCAVRSAPPETFDFVGRRLLPVGFPFGSLVSPWLFVVWIVGVANIYNFMDGVDGIAGLQAVVAGVWWLIFGVMQALPFVAYFGAVLAAGALGFLTLNWPPAKIFMGDAGSTVLGFSFALMPMLALTTPASRQDFDRLLFAAVLVLWPFLFDGTFTLFRRIRKRENILKAHRSHLYQRLVIAGKTHRQVTLTYGGLSAVGAVLAWWVIIPGGAALPISTVLVGGMFWGIWRWTVAAERAARD
jgi:UDP-N-acetylmuramyl pentapeptide phosphotransferase/UDP-N-acetylglucosamine-1-phosphate transferase